MFLTKTEITKQARKEIDIEQLDSLCGKCGLFKDCKTKRMEVSGTGKKEILIIGDTPSSSDDQNAIQFAGDSGKYFTDLLHNHGINLVRDCWKVNAVRCHNTLKDLTPSAKLCSGYIHKLLYTLKPKFVLILGAAGLVSVLHEDFSNRDVMRWRGVAFPDEKFKTVFFNTFHPRDIEKDSKNYLLKALFERDIEKACNHSRSIRISRKNISDYESYVKHLTVFKDVENLLLRILRDKPTLYHDYETSGLKPFKPGHFVATVGFALSTTEAYCFPYQFNDFWNKKDLTRIEDLWSKILDDPEIKKIAHNIKMEDVWGTVIFKTVPQGWIWDTMMSEHIIDNRAQWTGLKFQSFIKYGVRPYDKLIEEFIKSPDDSGFNNVHKAPLKELMTYCGLDCIFGMMLFEDQTRYFQGKKGLLFANNFFLKGTLCMGRIHQTGILMDEKYYKDITYQLTYKIKKIKRYLSGGPEAKAFFDKFGRNINFASGQDLGKLFYEVLGNKPVYTDAVKADGSRNYTTDAKTLDKLELPYIKKLIEMKKLIKARDTYLAQFKREVFDGIMYPFFDLNIAVTYRSSSSKPNWQNLPKRDDYIKNVVRAGVIPDFDGVISEIDFSGAEVITSASYHRDPTFIAYLRDKSTDMHRDQALDLWILDRAELEGKDFTRDQKKKAKKIRFYAKNNWTFAEFYGDWYDSCARNLWETCIDKEKLELPSGKLLFDHIKSKGIHDVEEFIEHCKSVEDRLWNEKFPVYTQWKKDITKFYHKHGYIETFLGFRFTGYMDRKQCTNFPIQGTSFHNLVYVLLETEKFIKKNNLKTKICGQIHDSIVARVPVDEIEIYHRGVSAIISTMHTKFRWLQLPMEAECSITKPREKGGNFATMYEIKPEMLDGTKKFKLEEVYA